MEISLNESSAYPMRMNKKKKQQEANMNNANDRTNNKQRNSQKRQNNKETFWENERSGWEKSIHKDQITILHVEIHHKISAFCAVFRVFTFLFLLFQLLLKPFTLHLINPQTRIDEQNEDEEMEKRKNHKNLWRKFFASRPTFQLKREGGKMAKQI